MIEHEELGTLIIASAETLKRQKMNCGIDKVLNLVQDSLEGNISRENFDKTLQFLIDNNSVKPKARIGCISSYLKTKLVETPCLYPYQKISRNKT